MAAAVPEPALAPDPGHWERIYRARPPTELSWYAPHLHDSLGLIGAVAGPAARIIDVGAGAGTLIDDLLAAGYRDLTALDLSPAALGISAARLGDRATAVRWIVGDVRTVALPAAEFDLWHDRALFHFLTTVEERLAYRERLAHALRPGGHLVIATFAVDGPARCSGLPVQRYDAATLAAELGEAFVPEVSGTTAHRTPAGAIQQFLHVRFRRR